MKLVVSYKSLYFPLKKPSKGHRPCKGFLRAKQRVAGRAENHTWLHLGDHSDGFTAGGTQLGDH